jgi:RNA polymerase sigma factor (sigma-70 family)
VTDSTFDEFCTYALPQLLAFAHRLTADPREAEDLVQAALVKTMTRWSAIERDDDPLAYARRVIIRTELSGWRRWSSRISVGSAPAHTSAGQGGLSADHDEIRQSLRSLPPRQRAAVVLGSESMSDAQVASALRCRPVTAASEASRGRAAVADDDRLRRALTDGDWSLPLWPAPRRQLRRAARRRTLVSTVTFVAVLAVAAGIAIPLSAKSQTSHPPHQLAIDPPNLNQTQPSLPSASDPRFPASVYPAPVGPVRGGFPQCPSIEGVGPRPTLDPAAYAGIVSDFGRPSLVSDLRRTDRSLWPLVLAADQNPPRRAIPQEMPLATDPGSGITVIPATKDDLTRAAASVCGADLVARSVAVQVGSNQAVYDTAEADILVIQRHGHLLIWGRDPTMYANGSFLAYRNVRRLIDNKSIVAPCSLNGVGNGSTITFGQDSAHVTVSNAADTDTSCSLIGWPTLRLATPDYTQQVTPTDVGPDTPVLLRSGQSATFTITARPCGGAHQTYDNGLFGGGDLALVLSVGPCGATVTSYTLDK